jgi:hypothetical protein
MTHRRSPARGHLPGWLAALTAAWLALGCAGAPQPAPDDSQLLLQSGFKALAVTTPEQQQHLQSLPPGKVSELQRTGKHFFVYPDRAGNRLLVGTPAEYAAYRQLRPDTGPTLGQQQAADIRSYDKQDAAMSMYTTRDLNDPYYFWPTWAGLWP